MARADRFTANPHWLPMQPARSLDHIPGEDGWMPILGTTLKLLADPPGYVRQMHAKYGPVYRHKSFGGRNVPSRDRPPSGKTACTTPALVAMAT